MPINEKIKSLLNKDDAYFEYLNMDCDKALLIQYNKALEKILKQIRELYDKYGMPTQSDVRKFNRLTIQEAQISKEIAKLNSTVQKTTLEFIKEAFAGSYYNTGFALETSIGAKLGFNMLSNEAIKFASTADYWQDRLRQWNGNLEIGIKSEVETMLRLNSREEIISGLAEGKPYAKVARAIEERFGVARSRATTIATDQMHKSQSKGRLEGIKTAEKAADRLGIKIQKVWKYNFAAKEPRQDHIKAEGQTADDNGMFHVGGELLEAPGLGEDPANNINCHCSAQVSVDGLDNVKQDKKLMSLKDAEQWKEGLN